MSSWGDSVRALAVGAALLAACGDDESSAPTTTASTTTIAESTTTTTAAPERPASTTTTAFDPATVEGEVEAAYLKSWDVYADAVYNLELDEAALSEVYAGDGLANVIDEIEGRIEEGRAAYVRVDHSYQVVITNDELASVLDDFTNHQVLIDPETKQPIEPDPNEVQVWNFVMKRIEGEWRVVRTERVKL